MADVPSASPADVGAEVPVSERGSLALTAIVVNYRTWEETHALLDILHAQLDRQSHEILVVNNCRRTHPPAETYERPVRFVESVRNAGFAGAVNLAEACARGRLLLVLNPDAVPQAGAVPALLDAHARHPDAAVLLPKLVDAEGRTQPSVRTFYRFKTILAARTPYGRTAGGRRELDAHLYRNGAGAPERVDWGQGAAMLIDPQRMPRERGRLMDERFFLYMEDVDLCLRAWRGGREVRYVPQAVFSHGHRRESGSKPISLANLRHFTSLLRFLLKYRGLPQRPQ